LVVLATLHWRNVVRPTLARTALLIAALLVATLAAAGEATLLAALLALLAALLATLLATLVSAGQLPLGELAEARAKAVRDVHPNRDAAAKEQTSGENRPDCDSGDAPPVHPLARGHRRRSNSHRCRRSTRRGNFGRRGFLRIVRYHLFVLSLPFTAVQRAPG
jgi:hypothetical protein